MTSVWAQLYVASELMWGHFAPYIFSLSFVYLSFEIGVTKLSKRELITLPSLVAFLLSASTTPLSLTTQLSVNLSLFVYLLLTLYALREQATSHPTWARPSAPSSEGRAPYPLSARLPLNLWVTLSARSRLFVVWCLSAPLTLWLTLSASARGPNVSPPPHSLPTAVMIYLGLISVALIKSELSQGEGERGEGERQELVSAARDVRRKRHVIATVCLTLVCAVYASQGL